MAQLESTAGSEELICSKLQYLNYNKLNYLFILLYK